MEIIGGFALRMRNRGTFPPEFAVQNTEPKCASAHLISWELQALAGRAGTGTPADSDDAATL
jgi:hypothetical protein